MRWVDISLSSVHYADGEIIVVLEVQLSAAAPRRHVRLAAAVVEYDIGKSVNVPNSTVG